MIVDLHTHVWESPDQLGNGAAQRVLRSANQPWERPDGSTTAHDAAMEPVQHAVILGFESRLLDGSISPAQVARYVARRPGKYLGFAGIDPLMGSAASRIDEARELGLVGVTISPAAQGFHPTHSLAWPLYEACAAWGLPLLVHGVTHVPADAKMEFAQPYLLDEIARDFPRLKIIISQVGHPWIEETLVLMGKHRNVFADLSNVVTRPWQLYTLLQSAHQQGVIDRLLFGSDFPFCTPQKAITTIYSVNTLTQGTMLPSVPREQLRSIVERDVLEVLGLKKKAVAGAVGSGSGGGQSAAAWPAVQTPAAVTVGSGSNNGSHAESVSSAASAAAASAAAATVVAKAVVEPVSSPAPAAQDDSEIEIESDAPPAASAPSASAVVKTSAPAPTTEDETETASLDEEEAADVAAESREPDDERSTVIEPYDLEESEEGEAKADAAADANDESADQPDESAKSDESAKPQA